MSANEGKKGKNGNRSNTQQEQERYWSEIGRQFAGLGGFSSDDADHGLTHVWACFKLYEAKRRKPTERMRATTLARIIETAGRKISLNQMFVSDTGEWERRCKIEWSAFNGRECLEWLAQTAIACAVYDFLMSQKEQQAEQKAT